MRLWWLALRLTFSRAGRGLAPDREGRSPRNMAAARTAWERLVPQITEAVAARPAPS